jgi:CelD/BcsL family acetyltransferase involved in cellulose biosynthesis
MEAIASRSREAAPVTARIHRTPAEIDGLRDDWNRLLERSRSTSVFLTSAWLAAAFRHVEEATTRLHVISVRNEQGGLVGVGPFCVRRQAPWKPRVLEFMAPRRVSSEYLDLVCDPALETEVVDAVWECLRNGAGAWDYARLSDVTEDSTLRNTFLDRMPTDRFRREIEPAQSCPYLVLPRCLEELYAGLSARFRGALRRADRKMSDLGVRRIVAEGPAALVPALERLYELHALRWETRGQSGKLRDAGIQRFHREVADRLESSRGARVYTLELEGRTIAALYGLEYKGTFFFYQSGFDPAPPDGSLAAWDYSPGLWVVSEAIQDCVKRGLREFDFLRGSEVYKTRWTARSRRTSTLILLPTDRWQGRAFHGLDVRIRRAKRRVRSWLHRSPRGTSV